MLGRSLQCFVFCSIALSCSAMHIRKHDVTEREGSNAIMMFAHGCSGSTAGIDILRKLLVAHHMNLAATGQAELMKTLRNSATSAELKAMFWTEWDESPQENERITNILEAKTMKEKWESLYKAAQKNNSTIVFKNELSEGHADPDAVEYMQQVGTKAFLFLRTNLLDDLSCRVKDFCDKPENDGVGMNVDATGKQLGCGFRGRGVEEEKALETDKSSVFLDVDKLVETLDYQEYMDGIHSNFLKKMGFVNVEVFSAEDLFAFEYGETYSPNGLALSTSRWQELLSNIGVKPNETTIKSVLKDYGTFRAPKNHKELFWNFDGIEQALRGTKYYSMLRV